MKTLFLFILSVLGLAFAGVLIVPGAVDWNRFKAPITEGLRSITGREVSLDGDVRFSVLPVPTLSVSGVRIGGLPGGAEPDLLRLGRLDARVALLPLFGGRIEVEHIALEQPELTLETLADGRRGWMPPLDGAGDMPVPRATRLDRIEIHDGTLIWRDDAGGRRYRFTGLHARISAASLAGPIELVGRGESAGLPLTLEAATGVIGDGASTPVRLALATLDGTTALHFAGLVTGGGEPRLQGDLRAETSGALAPVFAAFGLALPSPDQPFSLHAALDAARKAVSLTGMELQSGDAMVAGNARLTLATGQPPALELKLTAGKLDLGPWLAVAPDLTGIRLPADLTAGLDLGVDALAVGRGVLRQAGLRARLAGGALTLERLGALGPGGSELTVSGNLINAEDGPARADLRFEASTDNLRLLLDRLEIESSGIAGDRLRRASVAGRLRGRAGDLELSGLDLRLDISRAGGWLRYRDQGRPQLSAGLEADHLDLDAYRGGQPLPEARALAAGLASRLAGLDLAVSARLGRLTLGGLAMLGLELDATSDRGRLTLHTARIADLAGFSLSLRGGLSGLEPLRGIDVGFGIETASLAAAERALGLALPPPLRRLGALKLGGHLAGDGSRLAIAVSADSDPGPTAISGELAREDGRWRLSALHGSVAGTALKGEGLIELAGERPSFELGLETGEVRLDRLWPETPRPALRRWSVDRLDFGWLGGLDGRLTLSAAGLTLAGRRLGGADLGARLSGGILTLERLEGDLMGGRLKAGGRLALTRSGTGEAALTLNLTGARFDRGFFDERTAPRTVDVVAGTLDLEAGLTCAGDSELALIGSLSGAGRFAVGGGRLRGVDLPGLGQRIASLRLPEDVAARLSLGHGEAEGETPFERLDGAFTIENGIAAGTGLRLGAAAGSGEAEGTVDLPDRLLNLALHLHPDHQPPLPPIGVIVAGGFDRPQRTIDTGALQDHLRKELLAGPPP